MRTLGKILMAIIIVVLMLLAVPYIMFVWIFGGFLIKGIVAMILLGLAVWEIGSLVFDDKKADEFSSEDE